MNKNGPVIIIEDDADDQEILQEIFNKLNYTNEIIFFEDGVKALAYMATPDVHPFLIISDLNLPKVSGFDLRKSVFENKQISQKCIPYLFFTTASGKQAVIDAYSLSVQGFFVKPPSIAELEHLISAIMTYWTICYAPNNFQ